eukprot:6648357-Alexandrium_andersonii.AAC.1
MSRGPPTTQPWPGGAGLRAGSRGQALGSRTLERLPTSGLGNKLAVLATRCLRRHQAGRLPCPTT